MKFELDDKCADFIRGSTFRHFNGLLLRIYIRRIYIYKLKYLFPFLLKTPPIAGYLLISGKFRNNSFER